MATRGDGEGTQALRGRLGHEQGAACSCELEDREMAATDGDGAEPCGAGDLVPQPPAIRRAGTGVGPRGSPAHWASDERGIRRWNVVN